MHVRISADMDVTRLIIEVEKREELYNPSSDPSFSETLQEEKGLGKPLLL